MTTEETISHKIMIYAEMRKPDRMNQFAVEEIIREELATLRAKAEAWDKGETLLEATRNLEGITLVSLSEREYMEGQGYTCRKVRVCKEVER